MILDGKKVLQALEQMQMIKTLIEFYVQTIIFAAILIH